MISQAIKLIPMLLLLGVVSLHGQTLNWSSLTNSTVADSCGDPLNNSYVFQIGTFATDFIPEEHNLPQWLENWRVFGTAAYSNNPTDLGFFTGTENVQGVSQYSAMFEGMKAYVLIYNAANTEYFLATTSSGKWTFPVMEPGCCPNGEPLTWSISDLGNDTPIWGGQLDEDGGGEHEDPGPYDIQTHAVPEPASVAMTLAACVMTAWRRRRVG